MSDIDKAAAWLDEVKWGPDGLVPVVTQEVKTGKILTLAWMNREALALSVECGHAVYWSRSKKRLWHKGEISGNIQEIQDIYLDCDCDAIVLHVYQHGGIACHTGRESCFFHQLKNGIWKIASPVIMDPKEIYPTE